MAMQSVLGLFQSPDSVASALENIRQNDFADTQVEVLTGTPYPEGAFGERPIKHRLYVFPLVGAIIGLSAAILLTVGTQASNPLVTGGKPILAIPPMAIIAFEGTMLGAIVLTVIGILFESRLPKGSLGLYDAKVMEGLIGVLVTCDESRLGAAEEALRTGGAVEIKREHAHESRR